MPEASQVALEMKELAQEAFDQGMAWDELFNHLYGPESYFATLSKKERVDYLASSTYQDICGLIDQREKEKPGVLSKVSIRISVGQYEIQQAEAALSGMTPEQVINIKLSRPL